MSALTRPGQVSLRRSRPARWTRISLDVLQDLTPKRLPLNFDHPDDDYSDRFFETNFLKLYLKVFSILERHLSCPRGWYWNMGEPWSTEFHDKLYGYVEKLARPGTAPDTWDSLLRDETDRNLLVSAVIVKLFDDVVFEPLLFGADEVQEEILRSQDQGFIDKDGFARSQMRSLTVRTLIGPTGGRPPRFWLEVDKLAVQTMALLLPYINAVGQFYLDDWQGIHAVYQEVHELVQFVAWLAVCIRWSPAVIRFDYARPGDRADADQVNLNRSSQLRSQREAEAHDAGLAGSVTGSGRGGARARAMARQLLGSAPPPPPARAARVRISVIPEVRRSSPRLGEGNVVLGQRVHAVSKAHVVYYHGLADEAADRAQLVPLSRWVYEKRTLAELRRRRADVLWGYSLCVAATMLPFFLVWLYPAACMGKDTRACMALSVLAFVSHTIISKIQQLWEALWHWANQTVLL